MKRLLITGAGGSPATNFVRSLRAADEEFFLVGTDCDKYYLKRSETDKSFLVPMANEPLYIKILNSIIDEHKLEFLHIQNDIEMKFLSENREKLHIKTFLPSKKTVETCLDKFETFKLWKKAGITQPETMLINDEHDLKAAFEKYGKKIWIRDTSGAGGKGSLPVDDFKIAKSWLDFRQGWGKYTAAELLEPDSITWMSIWKGGNLIVAQARRRVFWELSRLAPSGITGITGAGVTVSDDRLNEISQKAVFAIDPKPTGIFSVDLTFDSKGVPNPTEINIGRFFTTHEFFTQAGLNMPYIFVRMAYGEDLPKVEKISPLKNGLVWIRGVDFLPVLSSEEEIEKSVDDLEERKNKLG